MTELSNWGKWGPDDQAGTVNLITPAKRKAAAGLVKEGVNVSLSLDADLPMRSAIFISKASSTTATRRPPTRTAAPAGTT